MTAKKLNNAVEVSSESFVSMILHAAQNPTAAVHGLLMGSFVGDTIQVTKAIPVCHETPTAPLLEIAMGLVGAALEESVVGWYTAPERLTDVQPGPVALRIAANLATETTDPVLIVLNNQGLAACLKGDSNDCVMTGYGKDFAGQWMDPLPLKVVNESRAREAARKGFDSNITVFDLENHLEDDSGPDWIKNTTITNHMDTLAI